MQTAKKCPKIPPPPPPSYDEDLLNFNNHPGLAWTRASVFDFWSLGLAAAETAETPSGRLGWILNDIDSVWYNALYSVALNLIRQYAVMSVPAPTKGNEIFRVTLRDVLRSVPTFKGGFEDLTLERKSMLLVADIGTDLSRISLEVHEYNSDSDAVLPPAPESMSSPDGTPPPGARACTAFVDVANKTEITAKRPRTRRRKQSSKSGPKKRWSFNTMLGVTLRLIRKCYARGHLTIDRSAQLGSTVILAVERFLALEQKEKSTMHTMMHGSCLIQRGSLSTLIGTMQRHLSSWELQVSTGNLRSRRFLKIWPQSYTATKIRSSTI